MTKTPTLEKTQKGTDVIRFTIACNAGKDEPATFLWCVAYKQKAETIAKFFEKGSPIQISGELRQYNDTKGIAHFVCDVLNFGFVGAKRADTTPPVNERRAEPKAQQENQEDYSEDAPF